MDKKKLLLIVLALLLAFALGVIVTLLFINGRYPAVPQPTEPEITDSTTEPDTTDNTTEPTEETVPPETLTDSIHLPGYSDIPLSAGVCQQTIVFPNPPENFCFIRVRLELTDGTVLWESDLTAPGEMTLPMVLSQPLEAGRYRAKMVYECFRNEDGTGALNGAAYELNLNVS